MLWTEWERKERCLCPRIWVFLPLLLSWAQSWMGGGAGGPWTTCPYGMPVSEVKAQPLTPEHQPLGKTPPCTSTARPDTHHLSWALFLYRVLPSPSGFFPLNSSCLICPIFSGSHRLFGHLILWPKLLQMPPCWSLCFYFHPFQAYPLYCCQMFSAITRKSCSKCFHGSHLLTVKS